MERIKCKEILKVMENLEELKKLMNGCVVKEVILPKQSNWYGYCNMNNYKPKTPLFEELNTVFVRDGLEELKKLVEYLIEFSEVVNYKELTEFAIITNLMSWDMYELYKKTNDEAFDKASDYLSEAYYKIEDEFYSIYKSNDEAKSYFFEMTD